MDFSIPIISGLKLVVVSEKNAPQASSVDDLSGKEIFVNRASLAYDLLREQNQKFKQAGKAEIVVKESDPNLTEEDLLEMTNAGVIRQRLHMTTEPISGRRSCPTLSLTDTPC